MRDMDERISLLYPSEIKFRMIIVGGSALILRSIISRATSDIDVVMADNRLVEIMTQYDMNGRVNAYLGNFPLNFEDRIVLVYSGKNIDYYTASLEDIVISKLCSSRPRDLDDVIEVAPFIDWEKLDHLAMDEGELKSNVLNERVYKDFLSDYNDFVRRYRP
jgi:hypothetical protein